MGGAETGHLSCIQVRLDLNGADENAKKKTRRRDRDFEPCRCAAHVSPPPLLNLLPPSQRGRENPPKEAKKAKYHARKASEASPILLIGTLKTMQSYVQYI